MGTADRSTAGISMGQLDTPLPSVGLCRAKAEVALSAANTAADPQNKRGWLQIASGWALLAEEIERIAKQEMAHLSDV